LAWDPILETEGVTCAACHVRGGVVLTSRAKPASSTNAPHPIETSNHLGTSEFCANCHQASAEGGALPLYDTYGEWKASRYADAGVGCIDCHGGTQTLGAPADPHAITADPARALTIGLKLSEPVVSRGTPLSFVVTLQNTGAGHAFPTGSPFKTLRLEVSVLDEKGSLLADPFTAPLGRTLVESPTPRIAEDHRILPGETRRYEGKFTVSQRARAGNGQFRIAIVQDGREQALIERAMPITIE
jgi:mono/diheme cytochrome c family protein